MSVSPDEFRNALGRFPSVVTVVTTIGRDGSDQGMTVSAFCSVSLDPSLILICIEKTASVYDALTSFARFAVNVLAAGQEQVARRFAIVDIDRFDGIARSRGRDGIAILDDALAVIECRRASVFDGGDHSIIVGEVEATRVGSGQPLLYYRGGYSELGS